MTIANLATRSPLFQPILFAKPLSVKKSYIGVSNLCLFYDTCLIKVLLISDPFALVGNSLCQAGTGTRDQASNATDSSGQRRHSTYNIIVLDPIRLTPRRHHVWIIVRQHRHHIHAFTLDLIKFLDITRQMLDGASRCESA